MKTARFLLACAAVSLLVACGRETITAPVAAPQRPHADIAPSDSADISEAATSNCIPVTIVNPDGTTTETCSSNANGQIGTGY
jgi:hypothetical protein